MLVPIQAIIFVGNEKVSILTDLARPEDEDKMTKEEVEFAEWCTETEFSFN